MANVHVQFDDSAIKLMATADPAVRRAMDRLAAGALHSMKVHTPVDTGRLRSSEHAFRLPDGSIIIGPTADYAEFVNNDTRPHIIRSHGPWPLRNRRTGQVFGPLVHHPGTRGHHFIEAAAREIDGKRIRL